MAHTLARPNINVFFSYYVLGLIVISIVYTKHDLLNMISISLKECSFYYMWNPVNAREFRSIDYLVSR